jgi:preprotein translocase subunit SecG
MFYFIVSVHFFLCLLLVGLVLLQQGKGADMGPAFGSGGANSLFGAAGAAPFIVKLTTGVCILFMVTSIFLIKNYDKFAASRVAVGDALSGSVLDGAALGGSEASKPAAETTSETATTEAPSAAAPSEAAPAAAAVPLAKDAAPASEPVAAQGSTTGSKAPSAASGSVPTK